MQSSQAYNISTCGPCHENTCLNIFVVVIPKEGLGMTLNIKFYSAAFIDYIFYSQSYQMKDWRAPACQSFFWYDTDKDLKAHFLMTQHLCDRT